MATQRRSRLGARRPPTRGRAHHPPLSTAPPPPHPAGARSGMTAEPPPQPDGGWREDVTWLSGLNVLAGIWLIIAPWVLGYNAGDPKWNDVVFGAIVAFLAFVRIAGAYRESWLSLVNAAIGVWLFIAAFTIDSSWTAGWNDIILGVIVFALGIGSAAASEERAAI